MREFRMLTRFICILLLSISIMAFGQTTKRALVITIADYPNDLSKNLNWSDLSSDNDRNLVLQQLHSQEFYQNNIISLHDEQATAQKIREAFKQLINDCQPGDIVYVHYSGHGQQVTDLNRFEAKNEHLFEDELDGLDEALVAYDAPSKAYEGYRLENHIVDDELNHFFSSLKDKLGVKGQIIAVLDACHSGTASRGGNPDRVRGTGEICAVQRKNNDIKQQVNQKSVNRGMEFDFNFKSQESVANFIVFSGCKSHEKNREYYDPLSRKYYGSLTFSIVQSWNQLNKNSTYKDWYSQINQFVSLAFNNAQHPEIEGDNLDISVFNGDVVQSDLFFTVKEVGSTLITLNVGELMGLNLGDTIAFYPLSVKKISEVSQPLALGVISSLNFTESHVTGLKFMGLPSVLPSKFELKGYVKSSVKVNNPLRVGLNINNKKIKKQLTILFSKNANIEFVENGANIIINDTVINQKSNLIGLIARFANSGFLVQEMPFKTIWNDQSYDTLLRILQNTQRINEFRKTEILSSDYDFEIRMQRISADGKDTSDVDLTFAKYKINDQILLTLKNIGTQPIRFDILDIEPTNRVSKVDAGAKRENKISLEVVPPGKYKSFVFNRIQPPTGLEQLKIIASAEPLDYSLILNFGQNLSQHRGADGNPLFDSQGKSVYSQMSSVDKKQTIPTLSIKNIYFEILSEDNLF